MEEIQEKLKVTIDKTNADLKNLKNYVNQLQDFYVNEFNKFKDKYGLNIDQEILKSFFAKPYIILPKTESEWYCIVPRFVNFHVGWLDFTTESFNVYVINRYTQWLGELPDILRQELKIPEPEKFFIADGNLMFEEGKENNVKEKFGELLSMISKGSARIKKGKEFDLIAEIINSGSLPFIPKPVDKQDIREGNNTINFTGKWSFQQAAYQKFLEYGAIGVYWMTGAGKDIFSTYLMDKIKVQGLPNLYLAPTTTILEQMKKEYFPKYAPRLLEEIEKGELIIATYQSYDRLKDKEYGLIIFGECHVLPADTFSRLATLKCKYRFGASATPYREDGRTNYIFALTGYPLGLGWKDLMKILGKKYHDVHLHIVKDLNAKYDLVQQLLDTEKKTLIFVNLLAVGEKIADILGVPFIHGGTKHRIKIAKENKVFVASRVLELGISLKELEHIIEIDFLFGSRREQIQRTGRLFHSEKAQRHDIIMTLDEFENYGKRLHGLVEKGFRIVSHYHIAGTYYLPTPRQKIRKRGIPRKEIEIRERKMKPEEREIAKGFINKAVGKLEKVVNELSPVERNILKFAVIAKGEFSKKKISRSLDIDEDKVNEAVKNMLSKRLIFDRAGHLKYNLKNKIVTELSTFNATRDDIKLTLEKIEKMIREWS